MALICVREARSREANPQSLRLGPGKQAAHLLDLGWFFGLAFSRRLSRQATGFGNVGVSGRSRVMTVSASTRLFTASSKAHGFGTSKSPAVTQIVRIMPQECIHFKTAKEAQSTRRRTTAAQQELKQESALDRKLCL